jgi:hypothetical protein
MTDKKKSRFSEEQIIGFLRQAEAGMPIKDFAATAASVKRLLQVAWQVRQRAGLAGPTPARVRV